MSCGIGNTIIRITRTQTLIVVLAPAPSRNSDSKSGRYEAPDLTGNSALHKREGQNVLLAGGHVKFVKYPNVGIYNDNIWKHREDVSVPASACNRELGPVPYGRGLYKNGQGGPGGVKDAYLVGEANWHRLLNGHSWLTGRVIREQAGLEKQMFLELGWRCVYNCAESNLR
jgi:hypothetical protein